MKKILTIILGAITMLNASDGYKIPSDDIVKIFDQERNPYISFIPFQDFGLEISYPIHQTLKQLSDPQLKLAGRKFSKKLNAVEDKFPSDKMNIFQLAGKNRISIKFRDEINVRKTIFSPNYKKAALLNETESGVELIIVDVASGNCTYFDNIRINDIFSNGIIDWFSDNERLLVKIIPQNRGSEPEISEIPTSPAIEETSGKKSNVRTYQNLLKDQDDEKLFDHYFASQLVILNINSGKVEIIGDTAIYYDIEISPDNQHLLVETIQKPYSYQVPYYRFPCKFEVWNSKGEILKKLHQRGIQDAVPIGGTYRGPRYFQWQPLKNAALIWVEAQDKGNPKVEVDHRDIIFRQSAPFDDKKEEIFRTQHRYSGSEWSEIEDKLIYYEYDRDKLWRKGWLLEIGKEPNLMLDINVRDEYNDPGRLVHKQTENGKQVFLVKNDHIYYINNTGATPSGNFPYLQKVNLKTGEKQVLFKARRKFHETIQSFTSENLTKIIIRSEDKETPPNYFSVDLIDGKRTQITDYPNNFEALTELKKELITYQREDGIPLSGELYLPANHQAGERLPLVLNAYPEEYTDSSTAGQVTSSPNRFIRFWGASIRYFALRGYAVLTKASIPIVGDPETVNETFIDQTVSSVKAAIDHLDELGIIDPEKVGITGHSYGAFMVANVLAHSDICAAGIARSGAYNRTLTPFGFQSERRTFWEAKDFYIKVSPFAQAEKISEPILLIHGEEDPNSGTYPMQSRRFYQAIKGNGGTARLVILPYEGHSYSARKSGLHVLSEMFEWFDKYLKK